MSGQIFINVRPYQKRAIYAEKGKVKQAFYYRDKKPSLVEAIYKGRVTKVVKNLNFAFVDLGLKRSGFLYGKDILGSTKDVSKALKVGKDIVVQIKADTVRTKGARLTQEVGLAGLYLVYIPEGRNKITISRQINSKEERDRLSKLIQALEPKGTVIVRTLAQNQEEKRIKKEFLVLKEKWESIKKNIEAQKEPGQVHPGEEPLISFLKDALTTDIDQVIVDDKKSFKSISSWFKVFKPELAKKIEMYQEPVSLFEKYKLESQVQKSQKKKVPLKNGGFLIFEELEAFSVIDVNSGRFSGSKNVAKSILDLNMEAARVIADQVQLRRLGGIILVDFLDMESAEHGRKVVDCLEKNFKGDKSYPRVFPMGELGLVQITRRRSQTSVSHFMTEVCPSCKGMGRKKSLPSVSIEIFLKLESYLPKGKLEKILTSSTLKKKPRVNLKCHLDVKNYIETQEKDTLDFFNKHLSLNMKMGKDLSLEQFSISQTH